MTTYDFDRLAPGIAVIEAHYPGWESQIDLDALDMASWTRCVGGQLAGSYVDFATRFLRGQESAVALAFNADHPSEASLLTEAWVRVITERRLRAGEREAVGV